MPSGILGIGALGLNAAQLGIRTTQNNISNVNTLGYHRQSTNFANTLPNLTGSGFVGSGVSVTGLGRAYDRFLENEVTLNQGQLSRYESYARYATQMDGVLGNEASGLNASLNSFFSAVHEVANAPTSMAARQAMLSAGSNLTGRIGALDSVMRSMATSVDQQIQDIAGQVTNYAQQIAVINTRISSSPATGTDFSVNALIDQRDVLAAEINKLVGATAITQGDGSYNLFIGSGQALVAGGQANGLVAMADPTDPLQKTPGLRVGSEQIALSSAQITSGQMGGLLAFRDEMLIPTQRELGMVAFAMVDAFNAQHTAGFDLNGTAGLDFFLAPEVRNPVANLNNAGNASFTLGINNINLLANSDYQLNYDGTNYILTRLSDGTSYSDPSIVDLSTTVAAAEGFSLTMNNAMVAGDAFLIRPTQTSGFGLKVAIKDPALVAAAASATPGDNGNAGLLAVLTRGNLLVNSTLTLQSFYNQTVSRNASLANGADINVTAYDTLTQQATAAQQSFSGVNLDEEAANLIQYQQAYQAAARAMQVASTLLDEVLAIAR